MIRAITDEDMPAITNIYNHYIINHTTTFELEEVTQSSMLQRVKAVKQNQLPWLVVENENSEVIGYAYASKWKERLAYKNSVEITIYLDHNLTQKGLGTSLYTTMFTLLKQSGIHAVMAGISLPNNASVALHEKLGMKKVAHFSEVGQKFNQWIDVGYWQKLI